MSGSFSLYGLPFRLWIVRWQLTKSSKTERYVMLLHHASPPVLSRLVLASGLYSRLSDGQRVGKRSSALQSSVQVVHCSSRSKRQYEVWESVSE